MFNNGGNLPHIVKLRIAKEIQNDVFSDIEYERNSCGKVKLRVYEIETLVEYILKQFLLGGDYREKAVKSRMIKYTQNQLKHFK